MTVYGDETWSIGTTCARAIAERTLSGRYDAEDRDNARNIIAALDAVAPAVSHQRAEPGHAVADALEEEGFSVKAGEYSVYIDGQVDSKGMDHKAAGLRMAELEQPSGPSAAKVSEVMAVLEEDDVNRALDTPMYLEPIIDPAGGCGEGRYFDDEGDSPALDEDEGEEVFTAIPEDSPEGQRFLAEVLSPLEFAVYQRRTFGKFARRLRVPRSRHRAAANAHGLFGPTGSKGISPVSPADRRVDHTVGLFRGLS